MPFRQKEVYVNSVNNIFSQVTIKDNELINFAGRVFPVIPYETELQSELTYRLQDPDLAKVIHMAYVKNIKFFLNEEETIFLPPG